MKTNSKKLNSAIVAISGVIVLLIAFSIWHLLSPAHINYPTSEYHKQNIDVYFAPGDKATGAVIGLINNGTKEIHCAFRSLNHEALENTLFAKEESGVKVRVFIDADYQGNKRIYKPYVRFADAENEGMMHNNYCIVDDEYVFTGSLIFNENTIEKNVHDVIIIKSKDLAAAYNSDFWRLYNNQKQIHSEPHTIQVNPETQITAVFCPYQDCEQKIIDELNTSTSSISFAIYSFTNYGIIDMTRYKSRQKVWITGVVDKDGITNGSILLKNNKIPGVISDRLKDVRIHTKVFVVDNSTTITGSLNPSYKGVTLNNENIIIIKDKEIAQVYAEFIHYIYTFN